MSEISIEALIMAAMVSGVIGYLWWSMKQLILKVDDHEKRLVKVETILVILGDIKEDIGVSRTDVEVLKSRM